MGVKDSYLYHASSVNVKQNLWTLRLPEMHECPSNDLFYEDVPLHLHLTFLQILALNVTNLIMVLDLAVLVIQLAVQEVQEAHQVEVGIPQTVVVVHVVLNQPFSLFLMEG